MILLLDRDMETKLLIFFDLSRLYDVFCIQSWEDSLFKLDHTKFSQIIFSYLILSYLFHWSIYQSGDMPMVLLQKYLSMYQRWCLYLLWKQSTSSISYQRYTLPRWSRAEKSMFRVIFSLSARHYLQKFVTRVSFSDLITDVEGFLWYDQKSQ